LSKNAGSGSVLNQSGSTTLTGRLEYLGFGTLLYPADEIVNNKWLLLIKLLRPQ
jgi:hypothetical protein